MKESPPRKTHCSISSIESKEPMFGTAPTAAAWFLLEYRGNFSGKAFEDSKIPKSVKSHLKKELKNLKGSRLQLIKKHKSTGDELRAYIAVSKESGPRLYEIKFKSYEELLSLDIKKILKSDDHISEDKIYIICTNGEYDTCCGKFGMPVYLDVAKGRFGERTWEANHIGGHRFAATFVCLPEGIVYGHVKDGTGAEEIMELHEEGQVKLGSLRGRSCYSPGVQAAEYFIRKETGLTSVSELEFKSIKKDDKKLRIRFDSKSGKESYRVRITQDKKKAVKVIKSCGDKPSSIPQYVLLGHKVKQK